jgi:hypothetical protein
MAILIIFAIDLFCSTSAFALEHREIAFEALTL